MFDLRFILLGLRVGIGALALVISVACAGSKAPMPTPLPATDIEASVQADLPDVEATVVARVEATVEALKQPPSANQQVAPEAPLTVSPGQELTADVVSVVDGDTVDVVLQDGTVERVRLLGIDTPETLSPNQPDEYETITDTRCLDGWGVAATDFTTQFLLEETVTLVLDPLAGERDTFGRLLAYVDLRDQDFNLALIGLGLARAYTGESSSRMQQYQQGQAQARALVVGLWECELPVFAPSE